MTPALGALLVSALIFAVAMALAGSLAGSLPFAAISSAVVFIAAASAWPRRGRFGEGKRRFFLLED